jgi:predicted 2-oxoglutarate/Fe(II)-dependent dioxygenase YbiX
VEKQQLDGDRLFLLRGLLSPEECVHFLALCERTGFEAAPVSTETGLVLDREVRDSARLVHEDPELAARLWQRMRSFLPARQGQWQAAGLHERFRFYRYGVGQKFARHFDGYVEREDGACSHLTLLIYLNDDFEGGQTRFFPFHLDREVTVQPEAGTAVVFLHRQLHEGSPVLRGRKYVLRTDVMYRPSAE